MRLTSVDEREPNPGRRLSGKSRPSDALARPGSLIRPLPSATLAEMNRGTSQTRHHHPTREVLAPALFGRAADLRRPPWSQLRPVRAEDEESPCESRLGRRPRRPPTLPHQLTNLRPRTVARDQHAPRDQAKRSPPQAP